MEFIQTTDKGLGSFLVLKNDLIGRFINYHGVWENHLYQIYSKLIKPKDIILEGGANVGFHTVQFAKLASKGKVYAFEPQKLVFNLLSSNILLNNQSHNTNQYRLALGDKSGVLYMQPLSRFDQKDGCHNYGGRGLTTQDEGEEVEIITFDSLNIKPNMIKLDIQGSEIYALKGMEKTIDKCEPWFLLENYTNPKRDGYEKDQKVYELLVSKGYKFFRFYFQNPNTKEIKPHEDCIVYKKDKHDFIEKFLSSEHAETYELNKIK